jgi:hypothetical protein
LREYIEVSSSFEVRRGFVSIFFPTFLSIVAGSFCVHLQCWRTSTCSSASSDDVITNWKSLTPVDTHLVTMHHMDAW